MFQSFIDTLVGIWNNTGFMQATWQTWVMLLIACVLIYLAIAKQYEPLLLLPIALVCCWQTFQWPDFPLIVKEA